MKNENKTKEIKELIAQKVKSLKGENTYAKIAAKCEIHSGKISNIANNKIDCQLSSLIELAKGLRVHPRDLFNIDFDFEKYYDDLDSTDNSEKK
ncbi:helix-turn-helix transcriptional regulator [Flavobacterium sp. P4023]|uniref:Helix-turn-helix transcriptional regulator n=1 Tax=Flavobacterium flabelliforme TaxID=2816119 RepID=A0ABS5CTV5_9FLAO|nr:helix-turn-helix transcriptional regulator [Flavobacterium flabelliforme]MBP4142053.1 helix-turn-helix transcriptional regulator [Flavobacterium flabelliforme]